MRLFIRQRPQWINFLHTVEDIKAFEEAYVAGTQVLIGDLCTFNRYMLQRLLKLLEENPRIDCYSSQDIADPVLLSRFLQVVKDPPEKEKPSDDFFETDRSYSAVDASFSFSYGLKLYAEKQSKFNITLLEAAHNGSRGH